MNVAFWKSPDQFMPYHFEVNIAVNRGVNTKVTTELDEAFEWLEVDVVDKPIGGNGK